MQRLEDYLKIMEQWVVVKVLGAGKNDRLIDIILDRFANILPALESSSDPKALIWAN